MNQQIQYSSYNKLEVQNNMVDTGIKSELQNCIRNAQDCAMEMGMVLDKLPAQDLTEKKRLKDLCTKTGSLLKEAQQRCEKLL